MNRLLRLAVGGALCAATAAAQTASPPEGVPSGSLPPGHPPLATPGAPKPAASGLPPGHPPVEAPPAAGAASPGPSALPPGHPPLAGSPHGGPPPERQAPPGHAPALRSEPLADQVVAAPDLPAGTVEVLIRDELDRAVPNAPVEITVVRHDVAQGDSSERKEARTDTSGTARFVALPVGTAYSFHVASKRGEAVFGADQFQLAQDRPGQRVLLHVYPSTADIRQVLVGMRGLVVAQPREDVFQIEASFEVFNIGRVAWVPDGDRIGLPGGAKAVRVSEESAPRLVRDGESLRLRGTFGPGQHTVSYSFQLDNEQAAEHSFRVPLPPHVAELRVITEAGRETTLAVEGFPEAEKVRGQNGTPLLLTGKQVVRGDAAFDSIQVTVGGLRVPSTGRWYALALAGGIAAFGLGFVFTSTGKRSAGGGSVPKDDAQTARRLILDELVLLERLHSREEIGPKTYQETRDGLLNALARVESLATDGPPRAPAENGRNKRKKAP